MVKKQPDKPKIVKINRNNVQTAKQIVQLSQQNQFTTSVL